MDGDTRGHHGGLHDIAVHLAIEAGVHTALTVEGASEATLPAGDAGFVGSEFVSRAAFVASLRGEGSFVGAEFVGRPFPVSSGRRPLLAITRWRSLSIDAKPRERRPLFSMFSIIDSLSFLSF